MRAARAALRDCRYCAPIRRLASKKHRARGGTPCGGPAQQAELRPQVCWRETEPDAVMCPSLGSRAEWPRPVPHVVSVQSTAHQRMLRWREFRLFGAQVPRRGHPALIGSHDDPTERLLPALLAIQQLEDTGAATAGRDGCGEELPDPAFRVPPPGLDRSAAGIRARPEARHVPDEHVGAKRHVADRRLPGGQRFQGDIECTRHRVDVTEEGALQIAHLSCARGRAPAARSYCRRQVVAFDCTG